jgi:DNA polymerase-3 subunit alpha
MQNLCRQISLSSIDEIVALIALYRPGPMEWIPDYVRGKRDPSTVTFPHPLLEEICRETSGVMVYQEQVMEAAKVVAGYTLGGADMLRRAMGKKDAEAMAKERAKFVEGAKRVNAIDEKTANSIFDILNKFAGYGFNKSHSAAYAVLSYQTGYLKANYPVQFMAAMLSAELGNAEKVSHFVAECEAMGMHVLGPDVNESRGNFTPVSGKIRFGLAGIKGVGEGAAQKIIDERDAHGPFRDFDDFITRVDGRAINKRVLEHLVKTGAFDFSGAARKTLFDGIDAALATVAANARDKAAGQHSFLDLLSEPAPAPSRPAADGARRAARDVDPDDFTSAERLQFEKELLGFYVSGHPMNVYAGLTEAIDSFSAEALLQQPDRTEFRLAGIVSNIAKRLSKKDNRPWASFPLAMKNASVPLNLFADGYANYGAILAENATVLVQGNIISGTEGPRINVKECYPLDLQVAGLVRKVVWLLHPQHRELPAFLRQLRETLTRQSGDTRVELAFLFDDRVAPYGEVSTALSWKINGPAFQELRAHPAVAGVQIETRALELKQDRRWSKRS